MEKTYHPYHLVDYSPWPYITGCASILTTTGAVIYFHYSKFLPLSLGLLMVLMSIIFWVKDVVRESTYQGFHTRVTVSGLKLGFVLFIVSEILFFFSFFWAFFHSSLAPSVEIGLLWPPSGVDALNPLSVPLLNTVILLSSGATVTWCHYSIVRGDRKSSLIGLSLTIVLGAIFTVLQGVEYVEAPFSMADSVYGSVFFVTTGFHGLHVLIGTLFLMVCLVRLSYSHFTTSHHFGFEAASWYWHFVDVVWLFLYICVYWWGY